MLPCDAQFCSVVARIWHDWCSETQDMYTIIQKVVRGVPPIRADEGVTIRAMPYWSCAYALEVGAQRERPTRSVAGAAVRGVTVEELAGELLAEHVPNIDVVLKRRRLAFAGDRCEQAGNRETALTSYWRTGSAFNSHSGLINP